MKKILAVGSAGGHWVQLNRLSPLFKSYNLTYITTNKNFDIDDKNSTSKIYRVIDANNEEKIKSILMFFQILWIMLINRPQVVISTGAAPGFFALMIGKFLFAKTIWIDSIANAEKVSLSCRMVKRFADVRLTQWPHLANDSDLQYWGKVL